MSQSERNKALIARLVEIVNERRLDEIDEVATGRIAAEARRWIGPFAEAFPDFRMEVVEVVAEDEKVAGYFKCSAPTGASGRAGPLPVAASRGSTRSTSSGWRTGSSRRRSRR